MIGGVLDQTPQGRYQALHRFRGGVASSWCGPEWAQLVFVLDPEQWVGIP